MPGREGDEGRVGEREERKKERDIEPEPERSDCCVDLFMRFGRLIL